MAGTTAAAAAADETDADPTVRSVLPCCRRVVTLHHIEPVDHIEDLLQGCLLFFLLFVS
jgi:hypothetical protein